MRGFIPCSPAFAGKVDLWEQWSRGDVKDFHQYKVRTGKGRHVDCRRHDLGMGKQICEDWANVLYNEQVKIVINHSATQDFVNQVFEDANVAERLNAMQEVKMRRGTVAYIPYCTDAMVNYDTGSILGGTGININYVSGGDIIPKQVVNGNCTECGFKSRTTIGNKSYIYLQLCEINDKGLYDIENHLFEVQGGGAVKVDLRSVDAFAGIAPVYHTGSDRKPFAIDRPGLSNDLLPNSVYGISVFHNSIPIMKGIDIVYDSFVNEFILGKKRIYVTDKESKLLDGEMAFDPNDTVYYILPEQNGDDMLMKEVDMKLRSNEHQTAMDLLLNLLSIRAGFGPDNYKYNLNRAGAKTATEVISQKQVTQQAREKHTKPLDRALREMIAAIIDIGINVFGYPLERDAEVTIHHDDAVFEDSATRLIRMRNDATGGIIKPELYIEAAYGVDDVRAKEMRPSLSDLEVLV